MRANRLDRLEIIDGVRDAVAQAQEVEQVRQLPPGREEAGEELIIVDGPQFVTQSNTRHWALGMTLT